MDAPIPARKAPYGIDVVAGRTYFGARGAQQKQPFCDGSHQKLA